MSESRNRGFGGLRVLSLESRRATEMESLIRSYGGDPLVAPSMREVPLEQNEEALAFGERLLAGEVDAVLFLTGVGTRTLVETLESRYSRDEIVHALSGVTVVARGPKPVKTLRELGIPVTITVPEPNTWRELLEALETEPRGLELAGARVAVQEYGIANEPLLEGLAQRGVVVTRVPVYRWALPEDVEPLRNAAREVAEGRVQVVLFTNGTQVEHLLKVAAEQGLEERLRASLQRMVSASIGPTCTEVMIHYGVPVDVEPQHPRMGHLVMETAERAAEVLREKQGGVPASPRPAAPPEEPWNDAPFLKACRREPVPYTPVWLMRQAGRYMEEYREVRARHGFLELCKKPDLVAEVTVTAAERIRADAAIIFADILLIVEPLGLNLEYSRGDGPVISPTIRDGGDVDRLREPDPEALSYVYDAVRATRAALNPKTPLIGFCGAPFTLASYMIEGGGSRNYENTKSLMYRDAGAWHALMERVARGLIPYVNRQVEAGAQCIQIFDSWVGCLGPEDYREFVLPHSRTLIQGITPGVPVIHFGTGTATLLRDIRDAGGDVIGLDWRTPVDWGWAEVGHDRAVQGNLDPLVLYAEPETIRARAKQILDQAGGRPGHIFNLGHGILPKTPVDNVVRLIEYVHELSAR
ncbi:MAG TPA: uroporphyrinogen decarboxylase [Armatimonadota bacterium]|nr:uroporphyrinogen decarboxylase [Armatimonadota bacterium]